MQIKWHEIYHKYKKRNPSLLCRYISTVMRDGGRPKGRYGDQYPRKPDKLEIYLYLVSLVVAVNGPEILCC